MNQAVLSDKDGHKVLLLILEPGNVNTLTRDGKPVDINVEDMFPDGIPRKLKLLVGYSETPVADGREMRQRAEVFLDERSPRQRELRPHCPECRSTVEQVGVMNNDSPLALIFCAMCGCSLGMVPADVTKSLRKTA